MMYIGNVCCICGAPKDNGQRWPPEHAAAACSGAKHIRAKFNGFFLNVLRLHKKIAPEHAAAACSGDLQGKG
jgi:hypothetical protein